MKSLMTRCNSSLWVWWHPRPGVMMLYVAGEAGVDAVGITSVVVGMLLRAEQVIMHWPIAWYKQFGSLSNGCMRELDAVPINGFCKLQKLEAIGPRLGHDASLPSHI